MAKSEQHRQKKLAKKRSKELRGRRELARRNQAMNSVAGQMEWASQYPIHACLVSEAESKATGLRIVYLVRKVNDGRFAFVFFLVDVHCLGVKDAGGRFCSESEWESVLERSPANQMFVSRDPSYAKKLVDQAIQYAQSLGISPHPDYRKVAPIWGDVDATQCLDEFEFGLDGKPSYFVGPYDDEAKQSFIYQRLCQSVGSGNFHFTRGGFADLGDAGNFAELLDTVDDFESIEQR